MRYILFGGLAFLLLSCSGSDPEISPKPLYLGLSSGELIGLNGPPLFVSASHNNAELYAYNYEPKNQIFFGYGSSSPEPTDDTVVITFHLVNDSVKIIKLFTVNESYNLMDNDWLEYFEANGEAVEFQKKP